MSSAERAMSRWARLKQENRISAADASPVEEITTQNAVVESEQAEAEVLSEADLPDIETLDADSDFSVFLRDGVPEHLKKLALRKLWASDPVFANLDGLNDYDEDFSIFVPLAKEVVKEVQEMMARNREELSKSEDKESEMLQEPELAEGSHAEDNTDEEEVEDQDEPFEA